jgi:hypothetical protein
MKEIEIDTGDTIEYITKGKGKVLIKKVEDDR